MKVSIKKGLIIFVLITGCVSTKLANTVNPVTGEVKLKVLKKTAWFSKEFKSYKTDNITLDSFTLKKCKVTIIGGNWCSDTRQQLPRFIKIIEKCGYDKNTLKIIFVDRKKKCSNCIDSIANFKVKFIPVFIFYNQKGEEIGRITESPQKTLEADIIEILKKY